jgi:hypothetical protein
MNDALQELDEADREAVLLRYFGGQDFRSVGTALGISDDAARKRVGRAVGRLRGILLARGISSPESALMAALSGATALSISSDLRASIIRSALALSIGSTPKITSALFHMTSIKLALLLGGLVAGLGTSALLQRHSTTRLRSENESLAKELAEAQTTQARLRAGQSALDEELAGLRKQHSELLRLRDEVTRLRAAQRGQSRPEAAVPQTADQALENQQITIEDAVTGAAESARVAPNRPVNTIAP